MATPSARPRSACQRAVGIVLDRVHVHVCSWPALRPGTPAPQAAAGMGSTPFILPMALDGGSHFVSDLARIGLGFRDSNAWVVTLTGNALPTWFYVGDVLGSFNSWLRLITGVLLGVGVNWFIFPHFEQYMRETGDELETKLRGPT